MAGREKRRYFYDTIIRYLYTEKRSPGKNKYKQNEGEDTVIIPKRFLSGDKTNIVIMVERKEKVFLDFPCARINDKRITGLHPAQEMGKVDGKYLKLGYREAAEFAVESSNLFTK